MKTPEITKHTLIKISVIFSVFMIFLSGGIGLIEITIAQNPLINISSKLFNQSTNYSLALGNLIQTKEFMFLLTAGLILTCLLPLLSPLKAFLLTFVMILLAATIGYSSRNVGLIPIEYCVLTILVIYMMNVLVSYFMEIQSKQQLIERHRFRMDDKFLF